MGDKGSYLLTLHMLRCYSRHPLHLGGWWGPTMCHMHIATSAPMRPHLQPRTRIVEGWCPHASTDARVMATPCSRTFRLVAEGADRLEHVGDVRQGRVGSREGRHDLASVRLHANTVEARDDEALGRGDEAEDADHGEPAVVDLGEERLLLTLGGHLGGEAEGIPQVERHRVREAALEGREIAGLAAAHVVLLAIELEGGGSLGPHLEEADHAENLELGRGGERGYFPSLK